MPIETDEIALPVSDGRWVLNPRTRILEWQFYPPPATAPLVQDVVACPFCEVGIGQACRSKAGDIVPPHRQRHKARDKQWVVDMARPKCGTDSGYYHHRRKLLEPACADCRTAHADAERRRNERAA